MQWVFGLPVALLILSPVLFFLGGPILLWAGLFGAVIPIAFWADRAYPLSLASRSARTALLALWIPLGIFGLLAPLRALTLLMLRPLEGTELAMNLAAIDLLALDVHLFNGLIGLCGAAFAFYSGQRALRLQRHIRLQLERLPRAKAASAAMGLAELSGVARAVEDPRLRAPRRTLSPELEPGLPQPDADALLWKAELHLGRALTHELRQCFYLEDSSGRILVDVGAVRFKDQPGGFLMDSLQGLVLGRHKRVVPGPERSQIEILSLREGQELYAIGTVQPRADAPGGKVLAPDPRPMEQGLFMRLFPTSFMVKAGGDPTHANSLFLVSDARESLTRLALQRSARNTLWMALGWLLLSLLLAVGELQKVGPGHWLPARWFPPPPPAPVEAPRPAILFRAEAGRYTAVWRLAPDRMGRDEGVWRLDGAAKARRTVESLRPRAVLLLAEGEEQRVLEALAPLGLSVRVLSLEEALADLERLGYSLGNEWSLSGYADQKAPP